MKKIVSIFLAFTCLPFVCVGLYEGFQNKRELDAYAHTTGIVTGNAYSLTNTDGNVSGAYHPVVEFTDIRGNKLKFTDGIGSLPPDYETGSQVEVVFDAENSQNARIHSWKRFWLAPAIFIIVGLLPILIAFILIRRLEM